MVNPCHSQHLPLLPCRTITADNRSFPSPSVPALPRFLRLRTLYSPPSLTHGFLLWHPTHRKGQEPSGKGRTGGSGSAFPEGREGKRGLDWDLSGTERGSPRPTRRFLRELWEMRPSQENLPGMPGFHWSLSPQGCHQQSPSSFCLGAAPAPLPSLHALVGIQEPSPPHRSILSVSSAFHGAHY